MELREIFAPVAEEMDEVGRTLKTLMRQVYDQTSAARGKTGIIDRIVQHPFTVPGKRIRPALVLLCYHATGGEDPSAALPAAGAAISAIIKTPPMSQFLTAYIMAFSFIEMVWIVFCASAWSALPGGPLCECTGRRWGTLQRKLCR